MTKAVYEMLLGYMQSCVADRAHLVNRIARRAVIQQHPRRTQRPGGVQLVRVKEDFFLDARRRRAAAKAVRGDAIRHTAAKFS